MAYRNADKEKKRASPLYEHFLDDNLQKRETQGYYLDPSHKSLLPTVEHDTAQNLQSLRQNHRC